MRKRSIAAALLLAGLFLLVGSCMGGHTPGYPGDDTDGEQPDAMPIAGIKDAGPTITCAGSECTCDTGFRCSFECPDGDCMITCAAGSECDVDCAGGGCTTTCGEGSTCSATCTTTCALDCGAGATCDQECSGGTHSGCTCNGC